MLINSELIEPKHVAKRENNFFVCNCLVTKPMFDKILFPLQFGTVLLRISPVRKDHVIKFARAICLMCLIDSKENTAQLQEKQGCRLSRRPKKGQRVISLCFFEICFSLWFRSDSLSVSPEPGLQIHCVFKGFLFLFSNVLFFPCKLRVVFKVRKKNDFTQ